MCKYSFLAVLCSYEVCLNFFRRNNIYVVSITSFCVCLAPTFADWDKLWIGGIRIFSSFMTFVLIFLNPQEKYLLHYNSGNNYLALRDKTRIVIEVERLTLNEEKQIELLKQLSKQKSNLNIQSSPITTSACKNARYQIEVQKTSQYRVDKNKH